MKRYFITGTDTDCGKTYVTQQLLNYFSQSALAIKPIASGCMETENGLVSEDALKLQQNHYRDFESINPWRFKLPISPHLAAKDMGISVSAAEIAGYCTNVAEKYIDRLFIEGAGGLIVPLNDNETWLDFLKITGFSVILVVGMKLGCINHALLTEAVLRFHQIPCAGWIANCLDPEMLALEENIITLKEKLEMPFLAVLPFAGTLSNIDL